jgi:hypothetical protein
LQPGVYGYASSSSISGAAIKGEAEGISNALYAQGDTQYNYLFYAYDTITKEKCFITPYANLVCTGSLQARALRARHRNSNGQHVLTYASESAAATIEDVGTGRMSGGVANVQIDPAFASVMDGKWYCVFLTPLGDTRGLYVSMKTPSAFQVRETEHGRSTLEFDYRIVAHPLDAENDRLPIAPAIKPPRVIMHPAQ